MATLSLDDPRFQPLSPEEEERRKKQKKITEDNKQDLVKAGTDETDIELPAEDNSEVVDLHLLYLVLYQVQLKYQRV